jgi:hypothetical protein
MIEVILHELAPLLYTFKSYHIRSSISSMANPVETFATHQPHNIALGGLLRSDISAVPADMYLSLARPDYGVLTRLHTREL